MIEHDTWNLLRSSLPSERIKGINALAREAEFSDRVEIRLLMISETAGALKRRLGDILQQLTPESPDSLEPQSDSSPGKHSVFLDEDTTVNWMRHELEPAIGFLRLTASNEIAEYDTSATKRAIDTFRSRLDHVEALVRASAPVTLTRNLVVDLIDRAAEMVGLPEGSLDIEIQNAQRPISTDAFRFRNLLINILSNARDATTGSTDKTIVVRGRIEISRFYLTISNQFTGGDFSFGDIGAAGDTTKIGHQGQGLSIIRSIAERMDYRISLTGIAGNATLSINGRNAGPD